MIRFSIHTFWFAAILGGAVSAHAAWSKFAGPDSIVIMASGLVGVIPDAGAQDVILTAKRDSVYVLGGFPSVEKWALAEEISAVAIVKGSYLTGAPNGRVRKRNAFSSDWTPIYNIPDSAAVTMFAESGGYLFAATGKGVYRSSDNGGQWIPLGGGLPNLPVTALTTSGDNLFAVTSNGVFKSTDFGIAWSSLGMVSAGTKVRAVVSSGTSLFSATDSGVYRSVDNGSHWTRVHNGLLNSNVYALLEVSGSLFAGTGSGTFRSIDQGENWTSLDSGMVAGPVRALSRTPASLYAGRHNGVWGRPLSEVVSIASIADNRKQGFHTDGRLLTLSLAAPSRVNVEVYTLSGMRVAVLLDERLSAGSHRRILPVTPLPAGLYLYRMKTNQGVESRLVALSR